MHEESEDQLSLGQSDAGRADLYAIHDELELVNGAGSGQGPCAWSDSGGDKIFTNHPDKIAASGALSGVHQITGGTGKPLKRTRCLAASRDRIFQFGCSGSIAGRPTRFKC
jgi:hypothetical protein